MTGSFVCEPIPSLTSELLDGLKQRVEKTLTYLIKTNGQTRYLRESPVFSDFRDALDALGDTLQDELLRKNFRTTVPLTSYDSYEPFINKLVTLNPKERDVRDMFSPGLPFFVASSSATSGKKAKLFAKYRHTTRSSLEDIDDHANPVSSQGGKNCIIYPLTYKTVVDVIDDNRTTVGQFPITSMLSGVIRMRYGASVDKDPYMMTTIAPRATSPIAVSFIINYRSFLLMHILFALAEPQLETLTTIFGTVFIDMVRCMEEEWDTLIYSVETGVLPDWQGTSHVRQYLEPKFSSRPERAAHLRAVGKATNQPGWFKRLWPRLNAVVAIASGAFSFVIPKMQHYLGPDVLMWGMGFTASEVYIGTAFSLTDLSLFKATSDDIIEYLDVSKEEIAPNLVFAHEVEVGRRYEVVVTTRDGLWRYRLGDIIEIAGFHPTDGSPILRYIERRGAFVRVRGALVSEEHLVNAISSAQDVLGSITEFTVIVDEWQLPTSWAFLVEVDDELSASAHQAPARIEATLLNENFKKLFDEGKLARPTVHILKSGTFREYRALKIEAAITGAGQIKVPVVLLDPVTQEWMLQRVERVIMSSPT